MQNIRERDQDRPSRWDWTTALIEARATSQMSHELATMGLLLTHAITWRSVFGERPSSIGWSPEGVSASLSIPLDELEEALAELVRQGYMRLDEGRYYVPTLPEADRVIQEAHSYRRYTLRRSGAMANRGA